jgi:hypothetical protein
MVFLHTNTLVSRPKRDLCCRSSLAYICTARKQNDLIDLPCCLLSIAYEVDTKPSSCQVGFRVLEVRGVEGFCSSVTLH